jgi:hypothetical protein
VSRDRKGVDPRVAAVRPRREASAGVVPEPPEASFWLERTPLPVARRAATTPGAAPARGRSALAPPGTVCPKCDSPLSPSEPACPSCGLKRAMFGRFRAGAGDRAPESLDRLWRQLESRWSDPELHEQFLAQVSLCAAYAYAASRYRRAARQRQSDAIAKLQLERLSRMVHAVMAVSAVRPADARASRSYRAAIALLVLLVGVGGATSLYVFRRHGAAAQDSSDRVAPSITVRRGRNVDADGRAAKAFGGLHAAGTRSGAQLQQRQATDEAQPDDGRPDEARPQEAAATQTDEAQPQDGQAAGSDDETAGEN